ncbi:MAG: hypothetical protein WDN28_25555 [Chthoniobacter sp.]
MALAIVLTNVVMAGRFVAITLAIMTSQANSSSNFPQQNRKNSSEERAAWLPVFLKADGVAYIDDHPFSDDFLVEAIKARAPVRVLLKADRRVRYDRLKPFMVKLGAAGVGTITFTVINPDGSNNPGCGHARPFVSNQLSARMMAAASSKLAARKPGWARSYSS